jgi:DNA polymerase-3 subunit alpha
MAGCGKKKQAEDIIVPKVEVAKPQGPIRMQEYKQTKDINSAVFVGMVSAVTVKLTKRGTRYATFTLEDTTGHVECICFKYDDFSDAIREDAIIKVKGKFEHADRGNQISVFEAQVIELSEKDTLPVMLELHLRSADFDQTKSAKLNRILQSYPGRDSVVLYVSQSDGRVFRAQLPVTVDSTSMLLRSDMVGLFGPEVLGR